MKTLLLIDANSIIHRSFHAIPPFSAPDGRPTGALYGISAMLLTLWRDERPEYAAALFDRPEPTFRDEFYKEYKAQRPPASDELISQIVEAPALFEAFGIKTFNAPRYEADDLIATLAEKFKTEPDLRVVILTGDRDTFQLVEGDKLVVRMFNKGVSDTTIYDENAVKEKYGLSPRQMVDYKALVGDASDNIKGVPGVGPKTATEFLQKYGTLEKIFEAVPGDPKLEKRIGPFRREAELSKKLVILERHVPVDVATTAKLDPTQKADSANGSLSLESLAINSGPTDQARIAEYFKTLGSATLLRRLEGKEEPPKIFKEKPKPPQPGLF